MDDMPMDWNMVDKFYKSLGVPSPGFSKRLKKQKLGDPEDYQQFNEYVPPTNAVWKPTEQDAELAKAFGINLDELVKGDDDTNRQ